jgi:arsenate reductase-like glutaredoxin family protein
VRELLVQNGYTVEERDYFKEPFTEAELLDLVAEVGEPGVSAVFAARSPSLKKMGLTAAELSDDRKLSLMLDEPRLVRRPIIRLGDRLIIGASVKAITEALNA